MITGVAKGFAGGGAVVARLEVSGSYRPACLPIWGTYDGYGGVGAIVEGPHSQQCEKSFWELLASGKIQVARSDLLEPSEGPNLSAFIGLLSRSMIYRANL